ncbi:hypothetical protein AC249_AIPGENE17294 [Exaiptasia diaphana]|nr:hypothetical protein AC249_AIPGENE17294 [Exaiptasia diaphana]
MDANSDDFVETSSISEIYDFSSPVKSLRSIQSSKSYADSTATSGTRAEVSSQKSYVCSNSVSDEGSVFKKRKLSERARRANDEPENNFDAEDCSTTTENTAEGSVSHSLEYSVGVSIGQSDLRSDGPDVSACSNSNAFLVGLAEGGSDFSFTFSSENWENIEAYREKLRETPNAHDRQLRDIQDGAVYQKFATADKNKEKKIFSLVISSDGAPVLKSRKFNVWPLMCFLVELPPEVRYKYCNVVLTGLWYGKSKPDMKLFLKSFVSELTECSQWCEFNDLNGCPVHAVLRIQSVVPDLPAKAILLNTMQYNGRFGCGTCKHPGEYVREFRSRLHRYTKSEKRTAEDSFQTAEVAESTSTTIFGIKGQSVFGKLVALPDNAPIDWMHCVCEGVLKRQLFKLWFDNEHSRESFSLCAFKENLDEIFLSIKVPHDFTRKPRSFNDVKHWKASEFRFFVLFSGLPCLRTAVDSDIFPPDYFIHFALLVTALRHLHSLHVKISSTEVAQPKVLTNYSNVVEERFGTTEVFVSHRMRKEHIVYHSLEYSRKGNSCSYIVEAADNVFGKVICYIVDNNNNGYALLEPYQRTGGNVCQGLRKQPQDVVLQTIIEKGLIGEEFIEVEDALPTTARLIECTLIKNRCLYIPNENGKGQKSQVQEVTQELQELKDKLQQSSKDSSSQEKVDEIDKSITFLAEEYDNLKSFKVDIERELTRISSRLTCLEESINKVDEAIHAINNYSYMYQYNLKIIRIPQTNRFETTQETTDKCLKLFNSINTQVTAQDIDIAHSVPNRRASNFPPTIICKFTRRLAKESVMTSRKEISNIECENADKIRIFYHLSPKTQDVQQG